MGSPSPHKSTNLLTNPVEIPHHTHLCEKRGLTLEKLLHSDIHLVTHMANLYHSEIPHKILCMILDSSIRGHLVVPNPSKLIHLVIPLGQKCKKWYLSRFENSSSIFSSHYWLALCVRCDKERNMLSVWECGNIFEQIQITSELTRKIDKCQTLIHIRPAGKCHHLLISTSQVLLCAWLLGKQQVYFWGFWQKSLEQMDGWNLSSEILPF